jgi:UDP-glucuronate decarboxylase
MQKVFKNRVLVTGGAGFIGTHLCERLVESGKEVICVDNFSSGSRANLETLMAKPAFTLIEHDVVDPLNVDVDEIYHLACPASPVHYGIDPIHTVKTNVLGAINMLGLAKRLRVPILFTSTSEVYGDPEQHPQTESYVGHVNPTGPRACYDEGKRCAETLFFAYRREHNIEIKVARVFNTYGPKMHPDDGRVVSNFIMQALTGRPITVYGDGSQTRSFCYVEDTVDALIRLMATDYEVTGPINIGNPEEFSVADLAGHVIKETKSDSQIVLRPLPIDDPRRRRPDISLAHEVLNWTPITPLKDGLELTTTHFRNVLASKEENLGQERQGIFLAAKLGTAVNK